MTLVTGRRHRAQGEPLHPGLDDFIQELRSSIDGEVSIAAGRRGQYSSDASNYRVVPSVVAIPRTADELQAIVDAARTHQLPLTMRGAGTSVAGNAIGTGVVIDTSRHLNRILEIDPEARTATVEPGVIVSDLNAQLGAHGLRFGPDPSTHTRATFGGLIGNNACGAHALSYGRTADNVVSMDVIDGIGRRFIAGTGLGVVDGLEELVRSELALLRTEFGRFGRQVSGYSLEHLLPENGSSLVRALVGTEGTVAVVRQAQLRLVPRAAAPTLVVLGYADMASAADAVPPLLKHHPLAIEGMDSRLVEVIRRHKGPDAVPELPAGSGWMLVEVGGGDADESRATAEAIVRDAGALASRIVPAGAEAAALWRIREDGAGLAGRTPDGEQAWPGWEDAAVPPERLGTYLREFERLMDSYGVTGLPFGHFGDGCIHVRIDIPLEQDGSVLRAFMEDAAALVVSHGGSLSGEHGDGRARSELLSKMYSPAAIDLQRRFKRLFDPKNLLNPGIIVDPAPLDADLRRPQALSITPKGGYAFLEDGGDFTKAVHRCVGVGKCRADATASGGFMCPSYQATRDENDVTRGRARTLQEMTAGKHIVDGWRSEEVHEALDLCLSCKACASDCPAGVDMARYKSETLYQSYKGRIRPRSHYLLGQLPRWTRLATITPRLANAVISFPPIKRMVLFVGGMDKRRSFPSFAARPFRRLLRAVSRERSAAAVGGSAALSGAPLKPKVLLWADSLSSAFTPSSPMAAIRVLEDAGYEVVIPREDVCCGLTWISTGQLDGAHHRLSRLLDVFAPYIEQGMPVLGMEPSCTAVLRDELVELFPDDPRAHAVKRATKTLAELLTATPGWTPPDLSGTRAIVQPHCHHYAVMGFSADSALLQQAGVEVESLSGCCGLAGNFGMEQGHYEVSVQVAERQLLPALRGKDEQTILLADGFSCRTQAEQLADVPGMTLAELLAQALPSR